MRHGVGLRWEKNRLLNAGNAGNLGCLGILVGQNAWLMKNMVWVQRSQTLPVHMQARRLHERFCANIRPEAEGFVYCVRNCGFEVRLSHTASRRDTLTTRIVGVAVLSS